MGIFCVLGDKLFSYSFFVSFFFHCNFLKDLDLIWFTCENKTDTTCNCEDFRGCGLLKSSTTTGVAQYEVTTIQTPLGRF